MYEDFLNVIWKNLTTALGVGGFLLGIINLWRSMRAESVNLTIKPALAYFVGDQFYSSTRSESLPELLKLYGSPMVAIQVTNLSKFPITVCEIGFSDQHPDKGGRSPILNPFIDEKLTWPTKLESRSSVTYRAPYPIIDYPFTLKTRVYAKTECDHTALGDSQALKSWRTFFVKNGLETIIRP